MQKKGVAGIRLIFIAIGLLIGTLIFLRLFTAEDTWICEDGEWVVHGNPSTTIPSTPCVDTSNY